MQIPFWMLDIHICLFLYSCNHRIHAILQNTYFIYLFIHLFEEYLLLKTCQNVSNIWLTLFPKCQKSQYLTQRSFRMIIT